MLRPLQMDHVGKNISQDITFVEIFRVSQKHILSTFKAAQLNLVSVRHVVSKPILNT